MIRTLRAIFALLLAALWLPATAHCSLEAMAESVESLCADDCAHAPDSVHSDSCSLAESGRFSSAVAHACAPQPTLVALTCLACLHARLLAEAEPLSAPAWTLHDPDGWVPAWSFVTRASLPARAPSPLV